MQKSAHPQPPSASEVRKTRKFPRPEIPDHQLLRLIGVGSYGEVWLAATLMATYRAIKVVFRESFDSDRPYDRELAGIRKFEPISRTHEGFVDILHVGENRAGRYFYYVMELGDDFHGGQGIDPAGYRPRTLAEEIKTRGRLPFGECLRLGLSLCEAVGQLHKHNLVHRDIKPSNIIFVNGTPKLADIGLVTDMGEARSIVGTIGFIPPEGPGTPQADLYSLGKVLYETSTGKDRSEFPELPVDLAESPDAEPLVEFNEVIIRACHNDFHKRYQSAEEVQADLLLLEHGKSVRRLRFLERRLALLMRVGGAAFVFLLVLFVSFWELNRERTFDAQVRQRQIGGLVADGTQALGRGELLASLPRFVEARRLDQDNLKRNNTDRLRIGCILARCPKLVQFWSLKGEVSDAEFSRDGRQVVVAQWNGSAQVFDVTTGQAVSPALGRFQALEAASFAPDGQRIVTASQDQSAAIWDRTTGKRILQFSYQGRVYAARFSPDARRIALACGDGLVRIYDPRSGDLLLALKGHTELVNDVSFSSDGLRLLTASNDNTARMWDAQSGKLLGQPLVHASWVKSAVFAPDGRRVLTACLDRTARVWDVESGREITPHMQHRDLVFSANFSPDGRTILTASLDATVRLWDAVSHQPVPINSIFNHAGRVRHASFNPDGNQIVACGVDGAVMIWDLAGGTVDPRPLAGPISDNGQRFLSNSNGWTRVYDTASDKAVSPGMQTLQATVRLNGNGEFLLADSGERLRSGDRVTKIQIWSVDSGRPISEPISCPNPLSAAVLDDRGAVLAVCSSNLVELFDAKSRAPRFPPLRHDQNVANAVFSSRGDRLATVDGNEVNVWDLSTGKRAFAPLKHIRSVSHVEFSPTGRSLVTACTDNVLTACYAQIWDAATGLPVGPQLKHRDGVLSVCFSPDEKRVVTSSEDNYAAIWSTITGQSSIPGMEHERQVIDGTFSRDGEWVATGSRDRKARIWDVETGDLLVPAFLHPGPLTRVRFIDQGHSLVTTCESGESWVWPLPADQHQIGDLQQLAQLLEGKPASSFAKNSQQDSEPLQGVWRTLRGKYPADFVVSPEQLAAWHRQAARQCDEDKAWKAALFHLDRLAALCPDNPTVKGWRASVFEHLCETR